MTLILFCVFQSQPSAAFLSGQANKVRIPHLGQKNRELWRWKDEKLMEVIIDEMRIGEMVTLVGCFCCQIILFIYLFIVFFRYKMFSQNEQNFCHLIERHMSCSILSLFSSQASKSLREARRQTVMSFTKMKLLFLYFQGCLVQGVSRSEDQHSLFHMSQTDKNISLTKSCNILY